MVTAADMHRLAIELLAAAVEDSTNAEWMDKEDVSPEAMLVITRFGRTSFVQTLERKRDIRQAIDETALAIFVVGWEAGKQYGRSHHH